LQKSPIRDYILQKRRIILRSLLIVATPYCCVCLYFLCRYVCRCHTLQHTATHRDTLQHVATHCNTLNYAATRCNTLPHPNVCLCCSECACAFLAAVCAVATHYNTLQHIATYSNILQHTAPRYNTLQHTAKHKSVLELLLRLSVPSLLLYVQLPRTAINRNTLKHIAAHTL